MLQPITLGDGQWLVFNILQQNIFHKILFQQHHITLHLNLDMNTHLKELSYDRNPLQKNEK